MTKSYLRPSMLVRSRPNIGSDAPMMPASILMPGLLAATSTPPCNVDPPSQCAWYNSSLSPVERRERLLAAMTIDEKFDILLQQGVDRLHVKADGFNEAAHGVAWTGRATVFPCSMGMAATWDVPLVREMGRAVAHEGLAKHWREQSNALSFFAPNINIVRDVRWDRAQETYGEDPTLTGTLGAAYVDGMQDPNRTGVLAVRNVAKHFASYNLESNFAVGGTDGQFRLSYDADVSRADLLQTCAPPAQGANRTHQTLARQICVLTSRATSPLPRWDQTCRPSSSSSRRRRCAASCARTTRSTARRSAPTSCCRSSCAAASASTASSSPTAAPSAS